MEFDNSISLGAVLQILGLIGAVVLFISRHASDQRLFGYRLAQLEEWDERQSAALEKINVTLKGMADQEVRIRNLEKVAETRLGHVEKLIDDLRRGEGYILPIQPARRNFGGSDG